MIFHPPQSAIASDPTRFRVVCCGRRFGKTSLAIYEIAGKAYTKKNRKICYIAPTYQQARDIAWAELVKVLEPITVNKNETRLEITVQTADKGKSVIWLRGWEAVDTLRGQAFDFIVIDEIASMRNFEINWNTVIRPTLTDRAGEALFISTPKGFNHFYDLFNKQNDPKAGAEYKSFHFTSYDNPHIKKEEIDKARLEMTEDQFSQEYLADFRKQEGLVYKEFDRSRHIYTGDIPRQVISYMAGVDFGYTNPAAVPHIKKDSENHYWVEFEYYQKGQTDAQVADYVKAQSFNMVFPDPENPAAIKELTDRGVNVREVVKGRDSIKNGISKVRELMKQGRLHIHASCLNLIEEIESYHYPIGASGRNEYENPVKDFDHAIDALRYVIMTDEPYIDEPAVEFGLYAQKYH
jgi:PBSX family phage terminase large subunit